MASAVAKDEYMQPEDEARKPEAFEFILFIFDKWIAAVFSRCPHQEVAVT